MQRVIRRTQLALAQAARKRKKHQDRQDAVELLRIKNSELQLANMRNKERKRLISEIREDFRLGPIKPMRGIDDREREQRKGVPQVMMNPPFVLKKDRIEHWNIVPGDRVYVTTGKDKGKIGIVKKVDQESNSVAMTDLNMIVMQPPPFMEHSKNAPATHLVPAWLHHDEVKLVVPIPDPVTGIKRDGVVLTGPETRGPKAYAHFTKLPLWKRFIPGTDIEIPWPEGLEESPVNQPPDTILQDLYEVTYDPAEFQGDPDRPPMPMSVIDELRNKYSVFRTRHEEAWVKEKLAADEDTRARRNTKIVTPKMELARKIAREKKALKKSKRLTTEQLEEIGRAMAAGRPVFKGIAPPPKTMRPPTAAKLAAQAAAAEAVPPPTAEAREVMAAVSIPASTEVTASEASAPTAGVAEAANETFEVPTSLSEAPSSSSAAEVVVTTTEAPTAISEQPDPAKSGSPVPTSEAQTIAVDAVPAKAEETSSLAPVVESSSAPEKSPARAESPVESPAPAEPSTPTEQPKDDPKGTS